MATLHNTDPAYQRAKTRVDCLRRFYEHLTAYVVVNLFLFLINIVSSPHSLWFQWVLIGWGAIMVLEAINAFFFWGQIGQGWEERKIREFMERDSKP